MSVGGAFLRAPDAPPVGARLTFTFETTEQGTKELRRVEFQGEVTRSVPDAQLAGFAVRWIQARTYGSSRFLRRFLKTMFDLDMLVYRRETGHVAWTPAPRGMSPSRAVPKPPLVNERTPERAIAVASVHMSRSTVPRPSRHLEDRLSQAGPAPGEMPAWVLEPLVPTTYPSAYGPGRLTPPPIPQAAFAQPAPGAMRRPGNVIQLVSGVGSERRESKRHEVQSRVHFRLNATTLTGTVEDISETGMWIETSERRMPRVGDLLACRYPIPELFDHSVRLVGKVVRQDCEKKHGFAVVLLRIDDRGMPGAFKAHLQSLSETIH